MSEKNRPHIVVRELYNPPDVRTYSGGGGGSYPRTDIDRHSKRIFREAEILKTEIDNISQKIGLRKIHYKLELPEEVNVWTTQGANIEESVHGTIVGSPKSNIAHIIVIAESNRTY